MGDTITIRGSGFGNTRNESFVTIAGTPPTSGAYLHWTDTEISLRLPEFGEAGLVRIHRGRSRSNGALFTSQTGLPTPLLGAYDGTEIRISSIEPASGPVGTLISIMGNNFGSSRDASRVYFTWNPGPGLATEMIEAQDLDFGYEFWSEREIRVRVPDGASSGNLELVGSRGSSRPAFFEVSGMGGTKTYGDKRSYAFSYLVDFRFLETSLPNDLYAWVPRPVTSSSQRGVQLLDSSVPPFIENYRGSSLFQFTDALPLSGWTIRVSYVAEVYSIETNILNQAPPRLNTASPISAAYTLPSPLVPSDEDSIRALATQITRLERFPQGRAQRIYEWLINNAGIQGEALSGGVLEALEEGLADSYQGALLFCALARAVDIPAIPVAGVLVDRNQNTFPHYWAEFWIDGFGWVPVDPALGAGSAPHDFLLREDHVQYYFGNLDNQRITFSRAERPLTQITPWGRTLGRERDFALQSIWEEAAGGIESYSSLWSGVTITGMYIY